MFLVMISKYEEKLRMKDDICKAGIKTSSYFIVPYKKWKRMTMTVLVSMILLTAFSFLSVEASIIDFADAGRNAREGDINYHWSSDYIYKLADKNMINGYPVGNPEENEFAFRPDQPITRVEYIKMLINAFDILDENATCPEFMDVEPGSWYEKFVSTAKNKEITFGKSETHFAPEENISREQVMTFTARTLHIVKNYPYPEASEIEALLGGFTDKEHISDSTNFAESAAMNVKLEIVEGSKQADGTCRLFPKADIKRGEAAKILAIAMVALENLPNEEISSIDILFSDVYYNYEYNNTTYIIIYEISILSINNNFEAVLLLEKEIDAYDDIIWKDALAIPWRVSITYYLKNGEKIERSYQKKYNDEMFAPFLDLILSTRDEVIFSERDLTIKSTR